MSQLRDSIDFGKEDIVSLFRRMLLPTLMGMIFSAVFTITDGIFVGQGVGSAALAAVNFISPLSLISMGLGLMAGVGGSVVASINLAKGKSRLAKINITQAATVLSLTLVVISIVILIFPDVLISLIGCSDTLAPLAKSYVYGFAGFMVCNGFIMMGGFFVRLGGALTYAMICSIAAAVLNILLDYIFIFPLQMGIFGAGLATGIGTTVGCVMMIIFLSNDSNKVYFVPVKFSKKSLQLTARNIGYMCKLGVSSFLGHLSVACMLVCGNIVFLREMGDDGVAAYSVIGYITPLVLTLYNAIAQATQPIISYNYGIGDMSRVRKILRLAMGSAVLYSVIPAALIIIFAPQIAALFISPTDPAYALTLYGLPLFTITLLPNAINIVSTGYFQSVEQARNANIVTILRGYLFMIGCYATIPLLWGNTGAWLSTPIAEWLSTGVVIVLFLRNRDKKH